VRRALWLLIFAAVGCPVQAQAACDPIIGVSNYTACAIDAADEIQCWGTDTFDLLTDVPSGTFTSLDGGDSTFCAITTATGVACWGADADPIVTETPGTTGFVYVTPGTDTACALETDDTVTCWGDNETVFDVAEGGSSYDHIDGEQDGYCGVKTDGSLHCWGDDLGDGLFTEPAGTDWVRVSAVASHACAIDSTGAMDCWGDNGDGQCDVPVGTYLDVSAMNSLTVAIETDGDLVLWGFDYVGTLPSGSDFVALECSGATCCAVTSAGNVECFGDDTAGVVTGSAGDECPDAAPAASYVVVMVGM
jgi:hypothetical protein